MAEFEDVDIFSTTDADFGFPTPYTKEDIDTKAIYSDLMIDPGKESEDFRKKFRSPTFSDEQIAELYAPADYSKDKSLALMRLGLGLMQPTRGGQIGASISAAGTAFANELSQIKQLQRKDAKANKQGMLTAKLQQQAADLNVEKMIYDNNRGIETTIAQTKFKTALDNQAATKASYNKQFENAQKLKTEFYLDRSKPIEGQYRLPNADGTGYGEPFAGYEILDPDRGPLFFKPSGVLDAEGYPQMELIKSPEGIQRMPTTMTGTSADYDRVGGVSQILDLKSQIDIYDKNIMYLHDLRKSVGANPMRAGFLAGIKKKGQDFAQIISDALGANTTNGGIYNNKFGEGYTFRDGTKIKKGTKYQPIHSTVEAFLSQPDKVQQYIDEGLISQEDVDNMKNLQGSFDQMSAEGEALKNSDKDKYNQTALFADGEQLIFESAEEQNKIGRKLGWYDTDLPVNQARANAIIYAIARARKSSGRLNLDDIQRAAQDLNLYGFTSSVAVVAKLQFLEDDLRYARQATFNSFSIIPQFEPAYKKMIEMGYDTIDIERLRASINPKTKQIEAGASDGGFEFTIINGKISQGPE